MLGISIVLLQSEEHHEGEKPKKEKNLATIYFASTSSQGDRGIIQNLFRAIKHRDVQEVIDLGKDFPEYSVFINVLASLLTNHEVSTTGFINEGFLPHNPNQRGIFFLFELA